MNTITIVLHGVIVIIGFIICICNGDIDESDSKIISGRNAEDGEFPFQVQISYTRLEPFCGGTIIDKHHVLTAAHCVVEIRGRTEKFMVVVGIYYKFDLQNPNRVELPFDKIYAHPKHVQNDEGVFNDIAIIRVRGGFQYNRFVQPINIATEPTKGGVCIVIGWGKTRPVRQLPMRETGIPLQAVEVPVIEFEKCKEMNRVYGLKILPGVMCAGFPEGGKDACTGDSGGPLICGGRQAGITSFGQGCARPNTPGVYTDVSVYGDWIAKTLNESYKQGRIPYSPII